MDDTSKEQRRRAAAWKKFQDTMADLRKRKNAVLRRIDENMRRQRIAKIRQELDENGSQANK